jgi:hypothetical protein
MIEVGKRAVWLMNFVTYSREPKNQHGKLLLEDGPEIETQYTKFWPT